MPSLLLWFWLRPGPRNQGGRLGGGGQESGGRQPSRAQPNGAESFRSHPDGADGNRDHPVRAERSRSRPSRTHRSRAEPIRSEPNPSDPIRTEPMGIAAIRSEPNGADPVRAERIGADPNPSERRRTHRIPSEPIRSDPIGAEPHLKPVGGDGGEVGSLRGRGLPGVHEAAAFPRLRPTLQLPFTALAGNPRKAGLIASPFPSLHDRGPVHLRLPPRAPPPTGSSGPGAEAPPLPFPTALRAAPRWARRTPAPAPAKPRLRPPQTPSPRVTGGREIEKAKPIKCGTFGATSLQQRYLATGDFDGNLHIWNLEAPEIPVYTVKGHKEIINTIDGVGGLGIGEGAPEIVTGSRDGTVKVWDPRQKDTPVANMEPVQGESKRDCWTVAFGNAYNQEERVVCAGYDNGDIKLFDLRNMSLRWETNIKNGVCSVEFDRKDINMNKLVATSLEGKFHVFDLRTQHPTKGFASVSEKAHKSTMWQVRHLPQNREIFMTAGGAGSLHLWKYEYPIQRSKKDSEGVEMGIAGSVSLLQNVTLSTQPISSLDWSPDKRGLCVCSAFDQTVRVLIVTKLNKV
uniref:Dynein axonemal assembly factor 10 n=1 Tax=Ornithorhynchus anatinus TaxID=9258 RepID=A0A6I8NPF2_ORNAN